MSLGTRLKGQSMSLGIYKFQLVPKLQLAALLVPKLQLCPLPQKKSELCKKNNLICDYEKTK
jgi:hypothetical protein